MGTALMKTVARSLGCARGRECRTPKHCSDREACVEAWLNEQPTVTSCLFCPWVFEGSAAQGRARAAKHRLDVHPRPARKTRRRA